MLRLRRDHDSTTTARDCRRVFVAELFFSAAIRRRPATLRAPRVRANCRQTGSVISSSDAGVELLVVSSLTNTSRLSFGPSSSACFTASRVMNGIGSAPSLAQQQFVDGQSHLFTALFYGVPVPYQFFPCFSLTGDQCWPPIKVTGKIFYNINSRNIIYTDIEYDRLTA